MLRLRAFVADADVHLVVEDQLSTREPRQPVGKELPPVKVTPRVLTMHTPNSSGVTRANAGYACETHPSRQSRYSS
jgi:hypothetical protein